VQVLAKKQAMKIIKLSQHIGAEVTGIDLTRPVDEATRQELREAIVEHIALVIRGQKFTPRQFLDASILFGEPMERYHDANKIPGVPFVHELSSLDRNKDGTVPKYGPRWHTDHTNQEYPPKYTILYSVSLPRAGGTTSVANMRAGYAALPDDVKKRIDGMQTVNVMVSSAMVVDDKEVMERQKRENPSPILQPMVRTNPENGSKALYFHPTKTENIVGMSPEDSQVLFEDLLKRAVRPEFVYTHRYRLGDMFLWDNRSALHKANYDYDPTDTTQPRVLYRCMIKGERPY
jgi:taurine dioxygenase